MMGSGILIRIDPETLEVVGSVGSDDVKWAEKVLGGWWMLYEPEKHGQIQPQSGTVYWSEKLQRFSRQRPDPWSRYDYEKSDWVFPSANLDQQMARLLIAYNIYEQIVPELDFKKPIEFTLPTPCSNFLLRFGDSPEDHTFLLVTHRTIGLVRYQHAADVSLKSLATHFKEGGLTPVGEDLHIEFGDSLVRVVSRKEVITEFPLSSGQGSWYDVWEMECTLGQR